MWRGGVGALLLSSVMKHTESRQRVRLGWIMDGCADSTITASEKIVMAHTSRFYSYKIVVCMLVVMLPYLFSEWVLLLACVSEWEHGVMILARCTLCVLYRDKKHLRCSWCLSISLLKRDLCSCVCVFMYCTCTHPLLASLMMICKAHT